MKYFYKLSSLLNKKSKKKLLWLAMFSIFLSVIEVGGISAIMPLIDIATNFETIHENPYYSWTFSYFGFGSDVDFVVFFGLILFGFYIFRGAINLLYSYTIANFTENLYVQITTRLFRSYLSMPYQVFTNKNSSYLTKAIVTEASLMSIVIRDVLFMLSEIFVVVLLYMLMLLAHWKITLVFTVVLFLKTVFLTKKVSARIKTVGKVREKGQSEFYEVINRIFGNFEHIKLQDNRRLKEIGKDFSTKVNRYANANAESTFLKEFPRIFIETIGFSLIVLLLISLVYLNQSNIAYVLPILSLFILSLYRLLPSFNRILRGYNSLMYYHKSIDIIEEELNIPHENLSNKSIEFKDKIELTDVCFSYHDKLILQDISLIINKGEKVAFVGESGSGKSTLVDLIIGLNQPSQGEIKVDDMPLDELTLQDWRSQIGYISQQVYLFDGTIAANVCFGRKVDSALLLQVLKQANIIDFLQTKQGVDTLVGEGGVQLSGGQKQRIAIARALYGQPEILVLDEATSALDDTTEERIMDEIYRITQNKTLIIVAHRLSTIKGCDKVYEIKNNSLVPKQLRKILK